MGTANEASCERQSARMSKITNDGLTLSDTGYFRAAYVCTHMSTVGVKRVEI